MSPAPAGVAATQRTGAPAEGLEPSTCRLTAGRSAIELRGIGPSTVPKPQGSARTPSRRAARLLAELALCPGDGDRYRRIVEPDTPGRDGVRAQRAVGRLAQAH